MAIHWLRRKNDDGTESSACPDCGADTDESQTVCTACGYDIVREARIDPKHPFTGPIS